MRTAYTDVFYGPFRDNKPCPVCHNPTATWALYEVVEGDVAAGWHCGSCITDQQRPPEEAYQLSWADVRARRAQMLAATDWTQLPDVPEVTREEARAARQHLRDITELPTPADAWAALDSYGAAK